MASGLAGVGLLYLDRLPRMHGGPDKSQPNAWVVYTKRQAFIPLLFHHTVCSIFILEGVDDPCGRQSESGTASPARGLPHSCLRFDRPTDRIRIRPEDGKLDGQKS